MGPEFLHALTSASHAREGLFLSAVSGSPHISLEPRSGGPDFLLEGDLWYETGSSANSNLFLGERSAVSNTIVVHRFVTTRNDQTTIDQVVLRFAGSDAPTDVVLGANAVVIDNFFVTVNANGVSGSLIRNATWNGGFFMPNSASVAVSGTNMTFTVPSGAFIVESGSITVASGTLSVFSGNIFLTGPNVQFSISGSNVTASLRGNPIVSVQTGSVNSASLSPVPLNGTIYVNTASREVSVRAGGSYFELDVDAPDLVDGGSY